MIIIVILSLGGVLFIAAAVLYLQNHEDTIARHGNAYHAAKRYPRNTALYLAGLKHEKRLCRLNQYHLQRKESENLILDNLLQGEQKFLDLLEIESRVGRELNLRERVKFQHQQFMYELQQKFLNSIEPPPHPKAILKGTPGSAPINIEVSSETHQVDTEHQEADTEHQGRMKQAQQDYEYNNFRNQKDVELKAHKAELIHQKVKEWLSQGIPEDEVQRMRMDFLRLDDDELNQ